MAQRKAASYGMDNLSRLPKELLLRIISLLPMKDAFRTSALSTRWRYLYASRSDLDFYKWDDKTTLEDVIIAMDQVFFYRHRCPINRFRISFIEFAPMYLYRLIKCVMWHGITEIEIDMPAHQLLPDSLFTCKTLVALLLKLLSEADQELPTRVFLPSLKVLVLHNLISFPMDGDACERLLSNCPVLEQFDYRFHAGDCKLTICHPTLKSLKLLDDRSGVEAPLEIVIDAPSVSYLNYSVCGVNCRTLIYVPSLTEANIDFICHDGEDECYIHAATNLIRGIINVHKLHINGEMLRDFKRLSIPIPVFRNLTHLKISPYDEYGLKEMMHFLTYCESLETLHLQELPTELNRDVSFSGASCLSFRLNTLKIATFRGSASEIDVVKYLLQSARVLETLKIGTSLIRGKEHLQQKIFKRLLTSPRASNACTIVLVDETFGKF